VPTWVDNTIICFEEKHEARKRLLCFHHAGGSANIYKQLSNMAPGWLEVCAVQLPGRENRAHQSYAEHISQIIPEVALAEEKMIRKLTIILGHSFGAFIAFEFVKFQLARTLSQHIKGLICLAATAPHLNETRKNLHQLDDEELVRKLRDFGGTPSIILEDKELLQFFLPRIRADFKLAETYLPSDFSPIDIGIIALAATEDKIATCDQVFEWKHYSVRDFDYIECPGSHFFLHDNLNLEAQRIFRLAHKIN
jgi:surfactin synthase thioesterase subunit